ncbi:MAG: TonB-dependent receptor [Gammaproteobacteria bacterium]|nr:TonB-dependent receptor [Gammaproteobacteria bacterium]
MNLAQQTGTPRNPGAIIPADPSDPQNSPAAIGPPQEDVNEGEITFARLGLRLAPGDKVEVNLGYHYQESSAESRYEDNPEFGTGEEYVMYKFATDPQDNELNLISADIEFDLGFARLTSATGYSAVEVFGVSESSGFLRTNIPQYYFGYPRIIAPIIRNQSSDTFTQEIRLVSQGEGNVDWVAGAFYLKNDLDFDLFQPMPGINDYTNAYFGLDPALDFTDVLATGGTNQEFTDLALFGELSWNISDAWQVTFGARVFSQELKGTSGIPLPFASRTIEFFYYGTATDDFLLGGINPTTNDDDDNVFKFNTSYRFNDQTLGFFTYSQGFRSGGANQLPEIDPFGNDNSAILRFDPDKADNFEVGVKGTWNSQISYTATIFYVDWQDFQTTLSSPFGIAFVDNIAGAESTGLEVELNGNLGDRVSFGLSYAYINAETTEPFEQISGEPGTTVPAGTALPGATDHNLFGHIQYQHEFGASSLLFYTDLAYRDETTSAFRDQPLMASENFARLDDFTVWNASISWILDNYALTLFGENLSNERATSVVSTADFFGPQDQGFGVIRPLTIGLRFKWSYQ